MQFKVEPIDDYNKYGNVIGNLCMLNGVDSYFRVEIAQLKKFGVEGNENE